MEITEVPSYEFRLIFGRTRIECDADKEASNRRKHGYSLESAVHHFEQLLLPIQQSHFMTSDAYLENDEVRHMHMGVDDCGNVVVFVTTMRDQETVRIISYRRATRAESESFSQHTGYSKLPD